MKVKPRKRSRVATKKKAKKSAATPAKKKSRPQVCGFPGCGQSGHNARAHGPGGQLT